MACDLQSLLSNGACFSCLSPGQWEDVRLALLCRKVNGVTTPCDVATLLAEGACFTCLPAGQKAIIELSLLCQLVVM